MRGNNLKTIRFDVCENETFHSDDTFKAGNFLLRICLNFQREGKKRLFLDLSLKDLIYQKIK